jgi:hypothetical protein
MRDFKLLLFITISLTIIVGSFLTPVQVSQAQSIQDWSAPVNLSNSGAASNPLLVVDGGGVLHALWADEFDGYKYSSSTDGLSWTPPITVDFPFSPDDYPPVFLVDPGGLIHVFWRTKENELRYGQSLPGYFGAPASWSKLMTLDTAVYDFDVATDSESAFHVDYIKNPVPATKPAGVYYRKSQNGSAWSTAVLLYESQYFRSLDTTTPHVRIEASNGNVYAVWDDRSLKRVFMARSNDGGNSWGVPAEIIVPEASQGFKAPFSIEITKFNNNILLMWQVGDPGVRCTQFSQWSVDGGENWTEPIKVFDEFIVCPEKSEFLFIHQDYVMALFSIQGDLSLIAWNGTEWSNPESQSGLATLANPITFDPIIFRCQQATYHGNNLFVVGCDEGGSRDIWFTSRPLDPVEILFPLPSTWSTAQDVVLVPQEIPFVSSVADQENNSHALWLQSAASETDSYEPSIQYARWNGEEWSNPTPVITGLNGLPGGLSLTIDNQQRLLLTWVNQDSGDLMFSWANSNQANIHSEWSPPVVLPSPSSVNNSPDILVDASNRIAIAYAVTVNEERGIYLVYSNDLGETWSSPIRVFDAVSAGWQTADRPKLALTADGRLHILFTRFWALGARNANGLYYSQSINGGSTWSEPDIVSDQTVIWSDILGNNEEGIHRLWQEKEKSATVVYHQLSGDGGLSWDPPVKVAVVEGSTTVPTLSITGSGNLHLMQLVTTNVSQFQEWEWTNERWRALNSRELNVKDPSVPVSLTTAVTSGGVLSALILFEGDDLVAGHRSQLLHINRALDSIEGNQFNSIAVISPMEVMPTPVAAVDLQLTATPISPLVNLEEPPARSRNTVGVLLVVAVVVTLLVFVLPSRRTHRNPRVK